MLSYEIPDCGQRRDFESGGNGQQGLEHSHAECRLSTVTPIEEPQGATLRLYTTTAATSAAGRTRLLRPPAPVQSSWPGDQCKVAGRGPKPEFGHEPPAKPVAANDGLY
jgi:hypothetical protein